MNEQAIAIFCICDEVVKSFGFVENPHYNLFADRAYNGYAPEYDMREIAEILLVPPRKKNLIRQHSPSLEFILNNTRNRIETVFSSIVSRMPWSVRA